MTRQEAVEMIDQHKNKLIDVREMYRWTLMRVIINQIDEHDWENYFMKAEDIISR